MAVVAPEEQAKRRGARFLACVFWSRSPGSRPPCFPCSLRSLLAALAACCLLRLHASLALTLTVPAGSSPSFRRPKIFFELVLSVCALSFAAMTHCLAYVWGFDFQGPQPFEFLNDFTLSSWSDFLDIFLQVAHGISPHLPPSPSLTGWSIDHASRQGLSLIVFPIALAAAIVLRALMVREVSASGTAPTKVMPHASSQS